MQSNGYIEKPNHKIRKFREGQTDQTRDKRRDKKRKYQQRSIEKREIL